MLKWIWWMVLASVFQSGHSEARELALFNADWRFARFGAMPDGSQKPEPEGLEKVGVDDAGWRELNLPHDWGIEGPFRDELPNRTGKLPWAGIGWYRKSFEVPEEDAGKRIFVEFDGAMSDSTVWLNGKKVGGWPYGYSSFSLELTDAVIVGGKNVLAVRLDNKPDSSRWYPGGGIYRNVRLVKTAPVHVAHWGVFVTTPEVTENRATVTAKVDVENGSARTSVVHEIFEPETGKKVAQGTGAEFSVEISNPKHWDVQSPQLYTLKSSVLEDGQVVDVVETPFGIRSIEFTTDRGFLLNGRPLKVNGVCQHHDLGPLGAAVNTRALERQIEILQEMGCNAIRTAHNPPAPELLDLCDRMGMLVQVEAFDCWKKAKTENDYSRFFPEWHEKDLRAMVRRDRNHPCVFMWSTGNEVREQGNPQGHKISQMLTDIIHSEDTSRPVTVGCNNQAAGMNGFQKTVDVFGYNYKPQTYEAFRKANPNQPLYGSETASCISTRGEYFFPVSEDKSQGCGGNFQISSYDLYAPKWAYPPDVEFAAQDKLPWVLGEFVWTGFDYIGEPTPYNNDSSILLNVNDPEERRQMEKELEALGGNIPSRSSYFGIIDLCGFPKDRFYLYQAQWRPELPMAHILPHWNWPERVGEVTPVHVYTSGDEAELFLNSKSLGRKKKGQYEYRLRWDEVKYEPGELKVVAYKNGKKWAGDSVKTTGKPARIELSADRSDIRADGRDLSFVTIRIMDANGLMVPTADNSVEFKLDGPGEIIAVGNGDPTSHESFQAVQRKAFNGMCLVVIRSEDNRPGTLRLQAVSEGFEPAELELATFMQ